MPRNQRVQAREDVSAVSAEISIKELTTRKLNELPEPPRTMNAVAAVIAYKLFGLSDTDIAEAFGISVDRVEKAVGSASYVEFRDALVRNVLDAEGGGIRDLFQQHARPAMMAMVEALNDGSRADRITAAKDILDRAGHRPTDVVEHRHRMDGGLTIEVIRRDATPQIPTIDMEIADEREAS